MGNRARQDNFMGSHSKGWLFAAGLCSLVLATQSSAAILPFTGAVLSPAGGEVTDTTLLTSYTTSAGTVTDLGHAISARGRFDVPSNGPSGVRNFWGDAGTPVDGPGAAMNLDVSIGVLNAGDSNDTSFIDVGSTGQDRAQFFFSQEITAGIAGTGNDFYLVEIGSGEFISVAPLDAAGAEIGDAILLPVEEPSAWGSITETILVDGDGNVNNFATGISGVAFDFEDFTNLTGPIAGIGLRGAAGIDAAIVGVNSILAPVPDVGEPLLHVNRDTGAITLENTGVVGLDLQGYSITSAQGALEEDNWVSIAGNYDVMPGGDGTIDGDDAWTPLTASGSNTDLSEFQFGGTPGDGGTLGAGQTIALSDGAGAWIPWFNESDLQMQIVLADGNGTLISVPIEYEGNGDESFIRSDFNRDGDISEADWAILRDNNLTDLSSFSIVEGYLKGDVNLDGVNDIFDYNLFVSDFDELNGSGAFVAMLQSVPEPSSLLLLGIALGATMSLGRRQRA